MARLWQQAQGISIRGSVCLKRQRVNHFSQLKIFSTAVALPAAKLLQIASPKLLLGRFGVRSRGILLASCFEVSESNLLTLFVGRPSDGLPVGLMDHKCRRSSVRFPQETSVESRTVIGIHSCLLVGGNSILGQHRGENRRDGAGRGVVSRWQWGRVERESIHGGVSP